jgi:DNA polymerase III alpha subunit
MPDNYKRLDVEKYIKDKCTTSEEINRIEQELIEYQSRNMYDLLRYMIYLVDFMRANNIVWGVGRGSSVASYVLYLIGIHKVNSIQYGLDYREFLR